MISKSGLPSECICVESGVPAARRGPRQVADPCSALRITSSTRPLQFGQHEGQIADGESKQLLVRRRVLCVITTIIVVRILLELSPIFFASTTMCFVKVFTREEPIISAHGFHRTGWLTAANSPIFQKASTRRAWNSSSLRSAFFTEVLANLVSTRRKQWNRLQ